MQYRLQLPFGNTLSIPAYDLRTTRLKCVRRMLVLRVQMFIPYSQRFFLLKVIYTVSSGVWRDGLPPESGITLSSERVNELSSFMKECHAKSKCEYRRASDIVMRGGSSSVRDVAAIHGVSEKTVSV